MAILLVCNTGIDKVSIINLENNKVEECPLYLGDKPVGPYGIACYNNKIYTANNYNNSISIINLDKKKEISNIYVGAHPNDIKVFKDKVYIICGDSNSLSVMDLFTMERMINLKLDGYPHSIAINEKKDLCYVCNTEGNSISVIDCLKDYLLDNIKVGNNPTKIILSKNKKILYICESNFEKCTDGFILGMSTETNEVLYKIKVGLYPVDIYEDKNKLYVANLGEGSISVVDKKKLQEEGKIKVGGSPIGVIKYENTIYYSDYYKGNIYSIDLKSTEIKSIASGKEPNAMTII